MRGRTVPRRVRKRPLFQGLIIVAQIVQADSGIERAHGDSFFDKRKAAFQTAFNNI